MSQNHPAHVHPPVPAKGISAGVLISDWERRVLLVQPARQPTWEDVMKVLRDDGARGFRISIETDATVLPDAQEEQKNRVAFLTAITQFMQVLVPALEQGFPPDLAKALLLFGLRSFKVGREIEDALEQIDQLSRGKKDDGKGIEAQLEMAKIKSTSERDARKLALETQKFQHEAQKDAAELQLEQQKLGIDYEDKRATHAETQDMTAVKAEQVASHRLQTTLQHLERIAGGIEQSTKNQAEGQKAMADSIQFLAQSINKQGTRVARIERDEAGRIIGAKMG